MNTKTTGKGPSFRERMQRMDDIATRLEQLANLTAHETALELQLDAKFLREEALRMARALTRLQERDKTRKTATPRPFRRYQP